MKKENLYTKAQSILTTLYENKELSDIEKHTLYDEYIRLLKIEAANNNAEAIYELGQTYEDMNFWGVNESYNPDKCFYWYAKACELNHADACNNLASMYMDGLSCVKNNLKAIELYEKGLKLEPDREMIIENYKYSIKCINSSVIAKTIFKYFSDPEITAFLEKKIDLTMKIHLDKLGNCINLIKIKKSENLSQQDLDKIIAHFTSNNNKFLYNKISNRKIITVSFPKPLMMYYRDAYFENRTNSPLEYLKYRSSYFSIENS